MWLPVQLYQPLYIHIHFPTYFLRGIVERICLKIKIIFLRWSFLILITFALVYILTLLEENLCWPLLGLERWTKNCILASKLLLKIMLHSTASLQYVLITYWGQCNTRSLKQVTFLLVQIISEERNQTVANTYPYLFSILLKHPILVALIQF